MSPLFGLVLIYYVVIYHNVYIVIYEILLYNVYHRLQGITCTTEELPLSVLFYSLFITDGKHYFCGCIMIH